MTRDSNSDPQGEDRNGLSGEAIAERPAEEQASPNPESIHPSTKGEIERVVRIIRRELDGPALQSSAIRSAAEKIVSALQSPPPIQDERLELRLLMSEQFGVAAEEEIERLRKALEQLVDCEPEAEHASEPLSQADLAVIDAYSALSPTPVAAPTDGSTDGTSIAVSDKRIPLTPGGIPEGEFERRAEVRADARAASDKPEGEALGRRLTSHYEHLRTWAIPLHILRDIESAGKFLASLPTDKTGGGE
ncbi:MAG TPA: hypothetical protein VE053_06950 [Allosphingosinicella sp.]|nr:hypothetical protein [Allosphingosinicella sp.]